MKTTVILDDAVYGKVVEDSVRLYGSTRRISTVINNYLRDALFAKKKKEPRVWSDLRGTLKTDIPTQKLKDLAKEGWGP